MSRRRTLSDWLRDTHLGPSAGAHLARAVPLMGVRYPSVFSTTFIGPLPANATETIVCTSPPFTPPLDSAIIFIQWWFRVVAGTGTTNINLLLRRGATLAGSSVTVGVPGNVVTAGQSYCTGGCYIDQPTAVSGQQYTLTAAQTNATAAGTAPDVCLLVYAL